MSETVVKISNLVKRYKELIALDNFSLEIKKGEIFGLLGPNGSGKTTTINCLLSLLKYDKGEVQLFGEKMGPNRRDLKKRIGVVCQNVAVFDELTVYENIDYFCGLYIRDKKTRRQYVEDAIKFVDLNDFRKFYPKKLSGGLLRRLNIACGIAHKPDLIIRIKQMGHQYFFANLFICSFFSRISRIITCYRSITDIFRNPILHIIV